MCILLRRLPLVLPTSAPIPRVLGCGFTSHFGELKIPIERIKDTGLFQSELSLQLTAAFLKYDVTFVWILQMRRFYWFCSNCLLGLCSMIKMLSNYNLDSYSC